MTLSTVQSGAKLRPGSIERFVLWAVAQRSLVLLIALIVVGIGTWSLMRLPIDAIPDITGSQVQINTMVPGLAPEEIELRATIPIERVMAGQPGLSDMRSLTKGGLSQVTLLFEDGTDIMRARQIVTERLAGVREQLPPGASPQLAPITTGLGEIFLLHARLENAASGARSAAAIDGTL